MSNAIETADLARTYGRFEALEGLTLQVPAGSVFGLIGPNGAGKTTTIKLLLNLIRPSRGSARVLGTDTRRLGLRQLQRIGYVSESQRLPDWMTADELLDFVRPFYPTWDPQLCATLRARLGLDSRVRLRSLSRGMRMKAALLAALAYRPDLLVLDEPFSGLDPIVRDELIQALLELQGTHPWTAFLSSHDIDEVERLADFVGFIDRGRLILAERVDSLLGRFRRIEATVLGVPMAQPVPRAEWWPEGVAGRTVRFIDTDHAAPDALMRIARAYPGADLQVMPLTLREIFLVVGRRPTSTPQASEAVS